MKIAKKLIMASIVLPLTFGAASTFAAGGKEPHKGRHDQCGPGAERSIMMKLGLTDQQKQELKTLHRADKTQMKAQRKEGAKAHRANRDAQEQKIATLLLADKFDAAAATALVKQQESAHTQRRVAMLERQHKMLSVLTPEQKTQYMALKKERMQDCAKKVSHRVEHKKDQKSE